MNLFERLKHLSSIPPFFSKRGRFVVDDTIGIALVTATSYQKDNGKYLLVTSNLYKAQSIYSLLTSLLGEEKVFLFPSDELIRAETLAQSKEMVAHRLYVLNQIINNKAPIVIANLASACRYLPDVNLFKNRTKHFKVGDTLDISELKKELVIAGYNKVNRIDQSLQFAVRGDIIDIFSVNNDNPVRIELFGDEIESIRYFDLAKQTSVSSINEITILPANDILLSEEEIKVAPDLINEVLEKDKSHLPLGDFEILRDNVQEDIVKILEGNIDQRLYKYYGFLQKYHCSIFDYCKDYTRIIVDDMGIENSNKILQDDSFSYLEELHERGHIISHLEMYQDIKKVVNFNGTNTVITSNFISKNDDVTFDIKPVPFRANKTMDAVNIIRSYLNDNYEIVIALNTHEHILTIQEELVSLGIQYDAISDFNLPKKNKVGIGLVNLPSGFVIPEIKLVYLTSFELFNEKVKIGRYDNRFKEATILKNFEDLKPGDFVVHEYQGVGQFIELQTIQDDDGCKDYLKIAYHGGEILYVPLSQFQLVRKFIGKEGISPRLSRLHSKDWENTKKRIKARVNDLAERLMHLYIERSKIKGFAFQKDDEFQKEFDASFEHELTRDQKQAIEDIKKDMESESPMDRLLCGDVGFGKTEVAFEAAFKAINSGKQVAILCPTTLLARQHYELALERFSPFDIKVAIFSRLISEKTQQNYVKLIKEGKIHLAIGTHRLLSKEIQFKDLGLLIVDEEQRFGVEQKERIKELKSNIDVLTLSATPIPRTLQISLLGVRSMSMITTAPQERMPIQTYVTPFNFEIVKELIQRELGRDGQVYYLHNNVDTLYQCAARIQKALPNINIGVAHGQMNRNDIEDVMLKFYKGDIKVLVCTSIVENGLDVPNANMIIVEDSENYGLSQLYQIKGRVGRSDRIAYAYLMYSAHKVLKEKAQKRLKALQEFTELGSGYKIAQRDLMIRGAGDILGPEQAGFIDSIGLDMYIKLLNEAVKEKMTGQVEEPIEANPTLSIEAYIPKEFASDSDKIELYQEILSAPDIEVLSKIKLNTRDIFGKLPVEVEQLFVKKSIDLLMKEANVDDLTERKAIIDITLGKSYINIKGIGNILFESLIPFLSKIKISYASNQFKIALTKGKNWIVDLENILKSLVKIQQTNTMKEKI